MLDGSVLNWIAGHIWGLADDVLRDVYVRGKYRDVILPMMVLPYAGCVGCARERENRL